MTDAEIDRVEVLNFWGNCPVQADGFIDGAEFYFRARGKRWSMSIGGADVILDPDWYYEEEWGDGPFAAGWMPEETARSMMEKAFAKYRAVVASERKGDAP